MSVGDFTGFINHATTDHGLQDLDVRDLLGGDIEEIAGEHDEIGELTRFERAHLGVLMQLIGSVDRHRPQSLFASEAAVLAQAPRVLLAGVRRIGACDADLQREPFVQRIHREGAAPIPTDPALEAEAAAEGAD